MFWFRGGKDATDKGTKQSSDDTAEVAVDDIEVPAFEGDADTHYVFVTRNNHGEQFLMSTQMFSDSLPLLCSGTREVCDAFIEGHRMGFRNAASRRDMLLSLVSEEYVFAHKLLSRISDEDMTADELAEEMAFFERMRSDIRAKGQDQYLGAADFGDEQAQIDQYLPETRQNNVIRMTDYLGVDDGAA